MTMAATVGAAFETSVTGVGTDNNTTVIEFSAYENAHSHVAPVVTGTVYQTDIVPTEYDEQIQRPAVNREDPFFVPGLQNMVDDLDPLMCVDRCLKEKTTEILQKNPWLASRIVKSKKSKLAMAFPTEMTEEEAQQRSEYVVRVVTTMTAGFKNSIHNNYATTTKALAAASSPSAMSIIIADPITENTYDEIVDPVRSFLHVNTDSEVRSPSCTLWDVLVIPLIDAKTSQPTDKFLLVHSLNFCLADPVTLYKIYSMLVSESPVERLDPTRSESIDKIKRKVLGEDPNYMRSRGIQVGVTKRLARVSLGSSPTKTKMEIPPNQTSMWTIDEEKIKAIKEAYRTKPIIEGYNDYSDSVHYEPSVPYITTNDILTSWFLTQNKDSEVGCLVVDIRGMDHEIDPDRAGNYQTEIVYNRWENTRTPAWIRASLSRDDELLKRHGEKKLPGNQILSGGLSRKAPGVSTVSDWSRLVGSGVFETVFLEHGQNLLSLEPEFHMPILLQHDGSQNIIGWNSLTIFKYSQEKIGILVVAPPSATEGYDLPLDKPALIGS